MRAFLAINIEETIKKELALIQQELQKNIYEVKWVNPELLHITLKFLGEIKDEDIHNMENPLRELGANIASFSISFSKLGVFPDKRRPRVLWLGIDRGGAAVKNISVEVGEVLNSMKNLLNGAKNDQEELMPHITLGRKKKNQNIVLKDDIFDRQWNCQKVMHVDSFYLMESILRPSGPLYKPLKKIYLKNNK
jgi:RNA 2',3'-cyclic 3'-phosphodiesterase